MRTIKGTPAQYKNFLAPIAKESGEVRLHMKGVHGISVDFRGRLWQWAGGSHGSLMDFMATAPGPPPSVGRILNVFHFSTTAVERIDIFDDEKESGQIHVYLKGRD